MVNELDLMNSVCKRYIMRQGGFVRQTISEALYDKFVRMLPSHAPEFCFGFGGFLPSADNPNLFAGQILCAADGRYFACALPLLGKKARPIEYEKGDKFYFTSDELWNVKALVEESSVGTMVFDTIDYSFHAAYKALVELVVNSIKI